jgi:repressor LexA
MEKIKKNLINTLDYFWQKHKIESAIKTYKYSSTNNYQSRDKKRAIEYSKLFNIPVLGKIAAGQPILAEEYLEGYLPVDPNIYGMTTPDDYFYLKVAGESMNLKVHNGDYALIHKQEYAENGDIIVAIVNGDDEATMKRYKKLSDELVMLEPMSTYPMEPIVINLKETKFQIIGKAIGQFGKF